MGFCLFVRGSWALYCAFFVNVTCFMNGYLITAVVCEASLKNKLNLISFLSITALFVSIVYNLWNFEAPFVCIFGVYI